MPQSTLQQRAAFVLTMNELVEQVTPIVVMLGFSDHLDINGLQKKLKDPNAGTEVVAQAVISLCEGCAEVKTALRNEWRRTIFVSGPGYKHWPEPLKKATTTVAVAYREIEATLFAGDMQVKDELRPARMDYLCLLAELSKILSAKPLLEGVELTVDDCILKEHNVYLKQIRPVKDDGELMEMTHASVKRIERSMRLVGDGLWVRSDGETKIRTRISSENVDKINRAYQECFIEHKRRVPKHDIVTEIKTFDSFHETKRVFAAAPLEIGSLQLAMQPQLRLNLAAGACPVPQKRKS